MIFSMDPEAVVLEISSDEEGDWKGASGMSYDDGDDHNWLSDILDEVESRGIDDSDDVVLVGEVLPNPEKQNLKKMKSRVIDFVDEDDCVILENDPDKPTTIQNETGDESDDVCVVSEKGQVACRDYPHSRHLCVRFPFAANSHQRHCDQCYCYVCDSLAPCVYWGNGSSKVDHCHATDKDEFWKTERNLKKDKKEAHLNRLPQMTQVPPSSGSFQHMGMAQNHVLRPSLIHSISTPPTNPGAIPNMINQSRSRFVLPRNKFQSNLVSRQLNSTYNSNYPRDGAVHNNSSLGPRVAGVVAFKRPGSAGVFPTTNQCSYSSSLGNSGTRFSGRSNTFLGTPRPQAINSFDSLPSQTPVYSPQPTMRRHVQSEFFPQPGPGTLYECPGSYEYQVPPLQPLDTRFANPIPSQSGVSPQPNGTSRVYSQPNRSLPSVPLVMPSQPNYSVPPQPQVLSQPNYSVTSEPQLQSQQNYLTSVETQLPSQPNYMISSQPDFPSQTSFPVSSHPLVNNESLSSINCNYQKKTEQADDPSSDPNLTDFDFQLEGIAPPTNGCALVMDSGLVDLQYDSWIFEHQPVEPGTGFTAASPEHGLIDTINIFEF